MANPWEENYESTPWEQDYGVAVEPIEQHGIASRLVAPFQKLNRAAGEVIGTAVEPAVQMGSGLLGTVSGNIAGLAALPLHGAGFNIPNPEDIKQNIQSAMTYEPRSTGGQFISQNILAPIGGAIESGAEMVAKPIRGEGTSETARGMAANAVKEALLQGTGFLGVKGAPKAAESLRVANLAKAAALKEQQALNAIRNRIRSEGKSIGLIAPAEGMAKETLAKIGGADAHISIKNREVATSRLAEEVGLGKGAISDTDILNRVGELSSDYGIVEKALGKSVTIKLDFKKAINEMLKPMTERFSQDPKTFATYAAPIQLLEQQLKPIVDATGKITKQEIAPSIIMAKIKQLRSDARKYEKDTTGDPAKAEMASTSYDLANLYEDLMESTLEKSGKTALLEKFRDSRKKLSQIHVIEAARMDDGLIDLQKLSSVIGRYKKDQKRVTGNIKTVAEFANTFKNVTKPITKSDLPTATRWELPMALAAGIGAPSTGGASLVFATPMAARTIAPYMGERGMLQGKPKSYELPLSRRMAPNAVQTGMMGTAFSPYLEEQ